MNKTDSIIPLPPPIMKKRDCQFLAWAFEENSENKNNTNNLVLN